MKAIKTSVSAAGAQPAEQAGPAEQGAGAGAARRSGGWQRSAACGAGPNCVEVAVRGRGGVAVRDSKDPDGPVLEFTANEWTAFLAGVREGQFELPA